MHADLRHALLGVAEGCRGELPMTFDYLRFSANPVAVPVSKLGIGRIPLRGKGGCLLQASVCGRRSQTVLE